MSNYPDEEMMWLRLKDSQREAETRRFIRDAHRAQSGKRGEGSRLRRWLSRLGG